MFNMQILAFYALLIAIGAALGGGIAYKFERAVVADRDLKLSTIDADSAKLKLSARILAEQITETQSETIKTADAHYDQNTNSVSNDQLLFNAGRVQWADSQAGSAGRVPKTCNPAKNSTVDSGRKPIQEPADPVEVEQELDNRYQYLINWVDSIPKELIK